MSDETQIEFNVTAEDADRWADKLERMANACAKRNGAENEEGARMFFLASALVRNAGLELQQSMMFGEVPVLFDDLPVGEC